MWLFQALGGFLDLRAASRQTARDREGKKEVVKLAKARSGACAEHLSAQSGNEVSSLLEHIVAINFSPDWIFSNQIFSSSHCKGLK